MSISAYSQRAFLEDILGCSHQLLLKSVKEQISGSFATVDALAEKRENKDTLA
jgi:hypothetical protein